jgi:hypothetical protein
MHLVGFFYTKLITMRDHLNINTDTLSHSLPAVSILSLQTHIQTLKHKWRSDLMNFKKNF